MKIVQFLKKLLLFEWLDILAKMRRRKSSVLMRQRDAEDTSPCHLMELDLLKHKIRRLVAKLQKHDVHLEVFEHEDITYGDVIGKGGEGVVRKCTIQYQGIVRLEAAVKTLSDNSCDAICLTLEEIELLCLAQDHIFATTVKVYGMAAVPDADSPELGQLVIITEAGLMNALQLYQETAVPLGVTLDLFGRLAAALHLIHTKKIIHHDLKPENILITDLKEGVKRVVEKVDFRVIDMGMARRVYTDKVVTDDILGTNGYHPPEVLFEDGYDFRADVFMLGITFAVLLHSPSFLRSKRLSELLKKLHDAKMKELAGRKLYEEIIQPSIETDLTPAVKNMLCKMMERQEKRHISLAEISHLCSREAEALLSLPTPPPEPRLPSRCSNCSDSGISANSASIDKKRSTMSARETPVRGSAGGRRLRHRRRHDDTSPSVSVSSTRTCITAAAATPAPRRTTRAMKRYRSESHALDSDSSSSQAKRTRSGALRS